MTRPVACMSDQEFDLWEEAAGAVRNGTHVPCIDCPAAFAAANREQGSCNGHPFDNGRPRLASDDPRAARREQWRLASQRARERRRLSESELYAGYRVPA